MTEVPAAPSTVRPAPPRRSGARRRRGPGAWVVLLVLALAALLMLFPFWLGLINAFKPPAEYLASGATTLPTTLDFDAIVRFWNGTDFTRKLLNSTLISGAVALLAVLLSLVSAFAIGIGKVRGRIGILAIFMVAFTIPQESLVYPLYSLAKAVGLYDSPVAVVIVLAVLQSAFGTYMLSAVLGSFPPEVIEAAKLDGASRSQILRLVVLPLTRPTLAVLVTFFFVWTWNEFFLPLVMLPSAANQTVSVALGALNGQYTSDATGLAAASLAGILPALLFFVLFQRTLMRGITLGAVK
jgi:raffinose/stachyose/melibiose transport system permease protein